MPNDHMTAPKDQLDGGDVTIVCCYITRRRLTNPRTLYCQPRDDWDEPTRYMYNLSSSITTQTIPRTIFVKKHWTVEFDNNETKLFVQVNHPDVLKDVCAFARDVVCCQDALSEVLRTVSLDLLINEANQGLRPPEQEGPTCYANAVAAVVYLATRRIYSRHNGYPEFLTIRDKIIKEFQTKPTKGVDTSRVLREILYRDYQLRYEPVDVLKALEAVASKRPVLARFRLTDKEWDAFRSFYRRSRSGTLTKKDLDIDKREENELTKGHAVVLTSYNSSSLRFMNSWGSGWADGGFFAVESHKVLNIEFYDVYFNEDDLYGKERQAYEDSAPGVAKELYTRLRGLREARYTCRGCGEHRLVSGYLGNALHAICPCRHTFNPEKENAQDLALSLYLLSLCRTSETLTNQWTMDV